MSDFNADIDELLAKQLAGETTPAEDETVARWLAESAEHRRYFDSLRQLWLQAPAAQPDLPVVDTEAALQKVKRRLRGRPGGRVRRLPVWLAAAAAVVAVALAVWFLRQPAESIPVEIVAGDSVRSDTLSDGSVVVLDRAARISLEAAFGRRERRLQLSGTARFAVSPDRAKPFVIAIRQLEVRVVGTEFTIVEREGQVIVGVQSGEVELRSDQDTRRLRANERAVFEITTGRIVSDLPPDPNLNAWQDKRFSFDATPLSEVVRQLEAVYAVEIVLKNPALADCPLTGRYAGMPADRVLELIAETFSLSLKQEGQRFELDGADCGAD